MIDLGIFNESEGDVYRFLHGKKVRFADLYTYKSQHIEELYVSEAMLKFSNKIVTIKNIYKIRETFLVKIKEDYNEYNYDIKMIDEIISDEEQSITTNNDNTYIFKKGDLIRFKKNEKKKVLGSYFGIPIVNKYIKSDNDGKEFIACDIINDNICPYFLDDEYIQQPIKIDSKLIELVKENYIETLNNKKKLTEKEKKILDDLKTIEEMKSKVNIKDFKKIYAGALRKIPKNLLGIELLLNQWAFNKRHIYRMLDNNLSIKKEIEYEKDESLVQQDRELLYRQFPGCYYVLKSISNNELLNNKLNHCLNNEWTTYSRTYETGERVSKLLDEAFKSDKLNIEYSNIIAKNKIKGILEISIDPIEYLLMSCNVSGWSSCHTIHKIGHSDSYGCYSAGIFSYMCDKVSLIAFRHDGKLYDFQIGKQKVQEHSKNWRQMIWLKEDMNCFITSRQYPNALYELTKTVREMLEEQINSKLGQFTWVHTNKKEKLQNVICDNKCEGMGVLHYNDIIHNYNGDMCYNKDIEIKEDIIKVGSNPVCPSCGSRNLDSNSYPFCGHC